MQLTSQKFENRLIVFVDGRLDATWSDFFKETMLEHIRTGEHNIIIDANELVFLSSMGIRILMVLHRELNEVFGAFKIINAQGMVKETLQNTGFGQWLSDEIISIKQLSVDEKKEPAENINETEEAYKHFVLAPKYELSVDTINVWQPWDEITKNSCNEVQFEKDVFAFGIGGVGNKFEEIREHLGEFVGLGGHVAIQPPDERGRPDYFLSEKEFIPKIKAVQAIICKGEFSNLMRFCETELIPTHTMSSLIAQMFNRCNADSIGFVIAGEIEGLVGVSLINSPGKISAETDIKYPEIKNWLSFCGERLFAREQSIITGVAVKKSDNTSLKILSHIDDNVLAHLHATVFPFQFIPNDEVEHNVIADRFFNSSPPKAVMHLIEDNRTNGLGESALYNGACWFAPIKNKEILL